MNEADPHQKRAQRIPTYEEVALLAYFIYESEGRPAGRAWEHWFNAETMIESQFGQGEDHLESDLVDATSEP